MREQAKGGVGACFFGRWQSLASLKSPFYGLRMMKGQLILEQSCFPCCGGQGMRSCGPEASILTQQSSWNSLACSVNRCCLIERLQRCRSIVRDYQRVSGAHVCLEEWQSSAALPQACLWLQSKALDARRRGLLCFEKKSSDMWSLALAFAWVGGMRPKLIALNRSDDVFAWRGLQHSDVALVCGTHKLASEHSRYLFERLILQCYHFAQPMWLIQSVHDEVRRTSVAGSSVRGYVNQLKERSPLSFLSSSALWKFREICFVSS